MIDDVEQSPLKDIKFCYPNSSEDCYKLFVTILNNQSSMSIKQETDGKKIDAMYKALTGDEYNSGFVSKQEKLDKRVTRIEWAYAGALAIIGFLGLVLPNLPKLIAVLK